MFSMIFNNRTSTKIANENNPENRPNVLRIRSNLSPITIIKRSKNVSAGRSSMMHIGFNAATNQNAVVLVGITWNAQQLK